MFSDCPEIQDRTVALVVDPSVFDGFNQTQAFVYSLHIEEWHTGFEPPHGPDVEFDLYLAHTLRDRWVDILHDQINHLISQEVL